MIMNNFVAVLSLKRWYTIHHAKLIIDMFQWMAQTCQCSSPRNPLGDVIESTAYTLPEIQQIILIHQIIPGHVMWRCTKDYATPPELHMPVFSLLTVIKIAYHPLKSSQISVRFGWFWQMLHCFARRVIALLWCLDLINGTIAASVNSTSQFPAPWQPFVFFGIVGKLVT